MWPSIYSHTPCTQSTNPLTFKHTLIHIYHVHNIQTLTFIHTLIHTLIHQLIHIHNHTQDKCSEYLTFIIQSDLLYLPVEHLFAFRWVYAVCIWYCFRLSTSGTRYQSTGTSRVSGGCANSNLLHIEISYRMYLSAYILLCQLIIIPT